MIVIAVIAIITAIAVPNYRTYAAQQRLKGASLQIYYDLINARMQAVKQRTQVNVSITSVNAYAITVGGNGPTRNIYPDYYDVTLPVGLSITFNPNGRVNSAVTVAITSSSSLVTKKTITINISRVGGITIS